MSLIIMFHVDLNEFMAEISYKNTMRWEWQEHETCKKYSN